MQVPNLPLALYLVATLAGRLWPDAGTITTVLAGLALAGLVVWAGYEVVRGVNPFRRMLGATALVWQLVPLVMR